MAGISGTASMQRLVAQRAPLGDLSNGENGQPSRRRPREKDADSEKPDVEVQRFTLVSRGAPPTHRKRARHSNLLVPPGLTAHLGDRIQVCRCSECPGAGRQRLCRRDTELHPEYALLLNMVAAFEAECPNRVASGGALVTDACVREKSAFFILNAERRVVGYVAAVVAANRKVMRQVAEEEGQTPSDEGEVDETPHVLQVYVEPGSRRKGLAVTALALLLRGHSELIMDDPTMQMTKMVEGLGYVAAGAAGDSPDGRPQLKFVHKIFAENQ